MPYKYNVFTRKLDYYKSRAIIVDWQESVLSITTEYGDASASGTNRYIAPTTSGLWTAGDNIYQYDETSLSWDETTADEGMATWVEDEDVLYVYNGSAWVKFGSTTDHGILMGLADDDHPQYFNQARGDARYYTESEVDTISGSLNTKITAGPTVSTKTDDYVVTISDFDKSLRMNSALDKTFTLPSVGASEDGERLIFIKQGTGKMTMDAVDADYIDDSSAGGTIYTTTRYATIILEYVHGITCWVVISANGIFTTT